MRKLSETLDLIEFAMREETVDRATVRILVDDVRRTLLNLKVNPDTPTVEDEVPPERFIAHYTMHDVLWNDLDYRSNHGHRQPKGRGRWGFSSVKPGKPGYLDTIFWYSGPFGVARKIAAEHFLNRGIKNVYVCG